ncbi:MAG: deoxyhypusine synthase family protein [Saprospiraceae bacterium]|nr:deoxyhypusine synthase family protein [Saprospiraceae bacterium]
MKQAYPTISSFLDHHFRHFNAATVVEAAQAYRAQLAAGNKIMITMAGAMSTAELGRSLAEMIRQDKVHSICCTGANLEEDLFNLVAHHHYKRIPNYRDLSPQEELELLEGHFNRVTDTCIPEEEAMRRIEKQLFAVWQEAGQRGERYFPHEYFYQVLRRGDLEYSHAADPAHSWLLAAADKNLPLIVPGWEDSTCGNFFAAFCIKEELSTGIMRSGIEYMIYLADWYRAHAGHAGVGFFQIGGGIAGDFPICVVPMLHQDLGETEVPVWSYFCQISDSTTSYGSYSGAVPNEKITWGKLAVDTPKFVIESDATIVAPLIFAYVLGW